MNKKWSSDTWHASMSMSGCPMTQLTAQMVSPEDAHYALPPLRFGNLLMDQKQTDCLSTTKKIAWQRFVWRRAWGRGLGGGAGGRGVTAWLLNCTVSSARLEKQKVSSTAHLLLVCRGSMWGVTGKGGLHHIP